MPKLVLKGTCNIMETNSAKLSVASRVTVMKLLQQTLSQGLPYSTAFRERDSLGGHGGTPSVSYSAIRDA